ncbi:MAG: tRNA (adenosine(37)-N6)-threonylcarbamoyltransferase complex dimerization subunit type 1 TsaB [Moraxella sp.]|nr:tRNA (adenosine(37)-N6)-threonylcarbamoyltransferase complex dimerization subunit type 1 TsaB [Moraxella sp.]
MTQSTLMAFDTVFDQCSVAIMQAGCLVYEETIAGKRGQTELILPMIEKAFTKQGLDFSAIECFAFNRGPGAFSGIRINTAVVQALSAATGAPCVGVSSLEVLAECAYQTQQLPQGTIIGAAMDARQEQVYFGQFVVAQQGVCPIVEQHNPYGNECLLDYNSNITADVVVGDGAALITTQAKILTLTPSAADIARLAWIKFCQGQAVAANQALPVYLRDNAWKTLAEQGKA